MAIVATFVKMKFILQLVLLVGIIWGIIVINYTDIRLTGRNRIANETKVDSIPYVLIPGAGREYPESPNINYAFIGRIKSAASLWSRHKHIKLILSGYEGSKNYHEAHDMLNALKKLEIPENACILDTMSKNTFETVINFRKKYGNSSVLFISQPEHLDRIVWLSYRLGIDAWGIDATGYPGGTPSWFIFREYGARLKARLEIWGLITQGN